MEDKITRIHSDRSDEAPLARVIAITSGKGGVGKTNLTTNLAIELARRDKKVCILDADTGLANINILLGLNPKHTLEHLLSEDFDIDDVLLEGPAGVSIVPGASGLTEFADLSRGQQQRLFNSLKQIETRFDYLLIDTAAGIADSILQFVKAAAHTLLVLSPDPTSLTDAFALTRLILRQEYEGQLHAVVNMSDGAEPAHKVYNRFALAANKYLGTDIDYLGQIRHDRKLTLAVRLQHPVVLMTPDSAASQCFTKLAERIDKEFGGQPGQGFAKYWRDQQPEALVTPIAGTQTVTNTAPQTSPTSLDELHRRFVDCIQGERGEAAEFVAAIKPIIDAYVERFQEFPLDMRDAVSRYLELSECPDEEIRTQLNTLEELYEKRLGKPLLNAEETVFNALEQLDEEQFGTTLSALAEQYKQRFGKEFSTPDAELRQQVERLTQENEARAANLVSQLGELSAEVAGYRQSNDALESIREALAARETQDIAPAPSKIEPEAPPMEFIPVPVEITVSEESEDSLERLFQRLKR